LDENVNPSPFLCCREQTTHSLPFLLFKTTKISISPPTSPFFTLIRLGQSVEKT
jgi:hypothetical protein